MLSASAWSWVTKSAVTWARREDLAHLLAQPVAQARVEVRERLVEEDQLRGRGERPGEGDPLLLAAGELVHRAAGLAAEPDQLEHLGDPLAVGLRPSP